MKKGDDDNTGNLSQALNMWAISFVEFVASKFGKDVTLYFKSMLLYLHVFYFFAFILKRPTKLQLEMGNCYLRN